MDAPTSSLTPSRLRRFACMAYEAILLFGVVFLADYLLDTLTQSKHALALRHLRQAWLFVAIGVYFILCWRKKGQTLPMKTWNIQLVDKNGQTPGLGTLILRYILVWPLILAAAGLVHLAVAATGWASVNIFIVVAPFALFVWTWLDPEGQFLHDRLLGTRLRNAPPRPPKR